MSIEKKRDLDRLFICPPQSTRAKDLEVTKKQALWNSHLDGEAWDRGPGKRSEWKATGVGRKKENKWENGEDVYGQCHRETRKEMKAGSGGMAIKILQSQFAPKHL